MTRQVARGEPDEVGVVVADGVVGLGEVDDIGRVVDRVALRRERLDGLAHRAVERLDHRPPEGDLGG